MKSNSKTPRVRNPGESRETCAEPDVEVIVSEAAAAYILWLLTRHLEAHVEHGLPFVGAMTADRAAAMACWLFDVLPPHPNRKPVPIPRPQVLQTQAQPQLRRRRPPSGMNRQG